MSSEGPGQPSPARTRGEVRLVTPGSEHVPMLIQLGQDPDYRRWGEGSATDTAAAARAWTILAGRRWSTASSTSPRQWVLEAQEGGDRSWVPVGLVEVRRDGDGGGEIGYAVHPAHRGRGHASRAVRLAVDHAFDVDGLRLLRWRAEAGNWASRRVAWRAGFARPQLVRGLLPGREGASGPRDGWIATLGHEEPREPAHRWLTAPVLERDGILLRPWRVDQAEIRALGDLDDLARTFVAPGLPPADQEQSAAWIRERQERMAQGDAVVWCVADAVTDEPLGLMSVFDLRHPLAHGCGEVGYWLLPQGRGRGAVGTALSLAVEHVFAELGLHRLAARTDERNAASQRALLRAGFREVATERESCVYEEGGPRYDTVCFELLATDRSPSG